MRLIDADALVKAFWDGVEEGDILGYEDTEELIKNAPTIKAEPVRHGRWEVVRKGDWTSVYECSECRRRVAVAGDRDIVDRRVKMQYPYCHCGAKMEGGETK